MDVLWKCFKVLIVLKKLINAGMTQRKCQNLSKSINSFHSKDSRYENCLQKGKLSSQRMAEFAKYMVLTPGLEDSQNYRGCGI